MKTAILVLIGLVILLIWIFTAENRPTQEDPRIKWTSAHSSLHSPSRKESTESVEVPVLDPNLAGTFSGTASLGPMAGTQFCLEFGTSEHPSAEDHYRLIQIQGGTKKKREGLRGSMTALPSKAGFGNGYQLPLTPSGTFEIYFDSVKKSWSGQLFLNSSTGNTTEKTSAATVILSPVESCL